MSTAGGLEAGKFFCVDHCLPRGTHCHPSTPSWMRWRFAREPGPAIWTSVLSRGRQILYKIFFSDSPISGPSGSRQWPQSSCRGCHRQGSVEFFIGRCKAEARPPEAQASFTAETPETWLHIPLPVPIHTNIYARVVCHCPQGQLVCEGMGSGPSFYFQQGRARTDTA